MESTLEKSVLQIIAAVTILICFLIFLIPFIIITNDECSIDIIKDFRPLHPLLLDLNKNNIILPNDDAKINFLSGESLFLGCAGANNYLTISNKQLTQIICLKNKTFLAHNNYYDFKQLKCMNYVESIVRRTQNKCANKFTEIKIGFNLNLYFVPIITICFNEITKDSVYSVHYLSSKINNAQSFSRINFTESVFYETVQPSKAYLKNNQISRFERLLGKSKSYINNINYLSRGHLAPNADFIYDHQKRATFYYVNVAPQWQGFNGGNWNELEKNCRNFASEKNLNLIVYTGTYGNAKLLDVNNNFQNLSLDTVSNQNVLTVPEIFWKFLYDPDSKKGTVFIGYNNPYLKSVMYLCPNVCNKIKWLTWKSNNVQKGYSYCCEFTEFKKIVDYLPDIKVIDLLT